MKQTLFKQASKTYYYSTLLFPKDVREDVTTLYAFVRTADDFVDNIPQQPKEFTLFEQTYRTALNGHRTHNKVIHDFVIIQKRKGITQAWVNDFLNAMKDDLTHKPKTTIQETTEYMHGSAEVVGLMMCQLLNIPSKAHPQAKLLGRAMQYINFIRDIKEDNELGRQYLPQSLLSRAGLDTLSREEAHNNKEQFTAFIKKEIKRYEEWDDKARTAFPDIPRRYRTAIKTAADMYRWTAQEIAKNPLIIYEKKVKPSKARVLLTGVTNL